jgi:hypothetical protein
MSGRDYIDEPASNDAALAAALRALPESAPEPDLWLGIMSSVDARRRRRHWRYALPAAIAAAIALALLLPRWLAHDVEVPQTTPLASAPAPETNATAPSVSAADEITNLNQRSRTLERWIAAVAARAPQDGRDLMAAVEVEDLIGLVDVQLGGTRGDSDALPLWRQRVALLEDLAAIRGNAFALAENGADANAMPASFNPLN